MMRAALSALFLALACASSAYAGAQAPVRPEQSTQTAAPAAAPDGISLLLGQFEHAILDSSSDQLALFTPEARRVQLEAVAGLFGPGAIRAIVKERDRVCAPSLCRVIVDVFKETAITASVSTWRLDVRRAVMSMGDASPWSIQTVEKLNSVTGLFKLSLSPDNVYSARGVSIDAEDFHLQMTDGSVFVIAPGGAPTGYVIVGKGELTFSPSPESERSQMKIFAGAERLQEPVDGVFVRLNPADAEQHIKGLTEKQTDLRDQKKAEELLREYGWRTFTLDLTDLSAETWSLVPHQGDFIAEVATRRRGSLTLTVSSTDSEDVSFFERKARRNIAQYASREHLAARGAFYSDDDLKDYEVLDYDIDARFTPDRNRVEARAKLSVIVRAPSVSTLNIRLEDTLTLVSVSSPELGRLLPLRVRGRDTVIVTLPRTVTRGTRFTMTFDYAGTVALPSTEGSVQAQADKDAPEDYDPVPLEESYLYTNTPYWYPQPSVLGYATATLRVAVPVRFAVRGSGQSIPNPGRDQSDQMPEPPGYHRFTFRAVRPLRYISCVVAPLLQVKTVHVSAPDRPAGAPPFPSGDSVDIVVSTHAREKSVGGELASMSADIVRFYGGLIGDFPYPTINLVLVEALLPGGHTPAYMSVVNHVRPGSRLVWKSDPASIDGFREYFVAHELAHQWWGQAVGWKNYHEQWLSEAFAQYFSALYAERVYGRDPFQDILKRWQRWAVDKSDQGPIYLGYRVGHIKGDQRTFRAVVYNKGAIVLHMLRRLVGDDAFFRSLRRFYRESRFRKAGTDDLQRAFEAETNLPLARFFARWIYGESLPRLKVTTRTGAAGRDELLVSVEQLGGEVFDVPITVTLDYANKPAQEVTLRLADARQEFRIPLAGVLRRADFNRSDIVPCATFTVSSDSTNLPLSASRLRTK